MVEYCGGVNEPGVM